MLSKLNNIKTFLAGLIHGVFNIRRNLKLTWFKSNFRALFSLRSFSTSSSFSHRAENTFVNERSFGLPLLENNQTRLIFELLKSRNRLKEIYFDLEEASASRKPHVSSENNEVSILV